MKDKFSYKSWANREILESLGKVDPSAHPDKFKLAVRLLNHTYVVDRIFSAHLIGDQHAYTATNTVETPTVQELKEKIAASDQWFEQYVAKLTVGQLAERISFKFTDGDTGTMSREEILFHLLAHGAYHRGNVGMLLSDCGVDRPKDTFTRFLHQIDPSRREQS